MPTDEMAILLAIEAYWQILRGHKVDTYLGRSTFDYMIGENPELIGRAMETRILIMDIVGEPWNRS